jgi:hypothetical protein
MGMHKKKLENPIFWKRIESKPAAAAEQKKFNKYKLNPSRQTESIDLPEARDTANESVPVFTRNHAIATAMYPSTLAED